MKLKNLGYVALVAAAAAAFVIGSAGSGEAKAKKKAAAPPPAYCTLEYKQVCGVAGGMKYTYSNACWAAKSGATTISQGACKAAKAHKKAAKKAAKKTAKPAAKKPTKKK
jgi:hypothetical protein